jgi:hypothetical protein
VRDAVHPVRQRRAHSVGDEDLAGGGGIGQARRQVHGLAGDRVLAVRLAPGAARHHLAARQADVHVQRTADPGREGRHGVADGEGGAGGALRVVAVRDRRAEHRHDAVADVLVHAAAVLLHDPVGAPEEAVEQRVRLLRPEFAAQRREACQVGEEDGHLPPLALAVGEGCRSPCPRCLRGARVGPAPQGRDSPEDLLAVAERGDAEGQEVGVGQLREHVGIDRVLAEGRRVLAEPELAQPRRYVHVPVPPAPPSPPF